MEIVIDSKRNNPLLNRTEIYFTVKHEGEGTPNREIIRSELAEKINVNKEKVIINTVQSSFGTQEISCYAKIYPSLKHSKDIERDYILKRNKIIGSDKGKAEKDKKEEKKSDEQTNVETSVEKKEETAEPDKSESPSSVEPKEENKKDEEKTPEKENIEEKKTDETQKEATENKTEDKKD